jgi:hypothetical protein
MGRILVLADAGATLTDNVIANNTVYGNYYGGIAVFGPSPEQNGGCTNNTIKNNIVTGTVIGPSLIASNGCENPGMNGTGNVYMYNALGTPASNFIQWGNSTYELTYSAWEAAAGNCGATGCSRSLESDPKMVSPSKGDFALQFGSPAIGGGGYIAGISAANPPNIGAN